MEQQNDSFNAAFKAINMIYMALGAGMIMMVSVFYFMVESGETNRNSEMVNIFMYMVPMIGVMGYLGGRYMYGINGQKSKEQSDIMVKLANYRVATLIVWALLEAPALFAGVAYFLTGDQLFLAFFGIIFVGFVFQKPSIDKFKNDF